MATDRRIITFSESELKDAIFDYCRTIGQKLSDPALTRLRIESAQPIKAIVEETIPGDSTVFEENEIAAALILYCRSEKIPLPRSATKSLKIGNGSIALCTVWESSKRIHGAAPLLERQSDAKISLPPVVQWPTVTRKKSSA